MAGSLCALDKIDDVKPVFWPSNFDAAFIKDLKIQWLYENQKLEQSYILNRSKLFDQKAFIAKVYYFLEYLFIVMLLPCSVFCILFWKKGN